MSYSSKEMLYPGVWVYRDVFKKEFDLIGRVEQLISNNTSNFKWAEATVGYMEKKPDYRDCVDFKIGEIKDPSLLQYPDFQTLNDIWKDAYLAQIDAVNDYCDRYSCKMDYWEVMNFIKYGPGQHFQEHADHGYSYSATVSLVGYPNEGYVGGGLKFPKLNLEIQPKAGDLYIFPSTFLFSHIALPVTEGIKYSIVTMLDYNDHAHNQEFMQMRERWVRDAQNKSV
jgi:2OG-Fe(II) oxygenase superfamily